MDPGKIFQIITNSTLLATRLLSGAGIGPLEFTQPHYCAVLREDARLAAEVLNVTAIHKKGIPVRYSITGGNRDGLFTIDQHTGLITLAAALDYEVYDKHELVVSGEGGGQTVHTIVQVKVSDVNDNPPSFIKQDPQVTVIEEDDRHLPTTLLKVEARDKDDLDYQGLLYTVRGDGVDGYKPSEAYFTINSLTGELIQQRALDRDPPWGKAVWKVRVQVRDGQALWSRPRDKRQDHNHRASYFVMKKSIDSNVQVELSSGSSRLSSKKRRRERNDDKYDDDRWLRKTKRRGGEGIEKREASHRWREKVEKQPHEERLGPDQDPLTKNLGTGHKSEILKGLNYRMATDRMSIHSIEDDNGIQNKVSLEKKPSGLHEYPRGPFTNSGENEKIIQFNKFRLDDNILDHITNKLNDADKNKKRSHEFPLRETNKSASQDRQRVQGDESSGGEYFSQWAAGKTSVPLLERILSPRRKGSKSIAGYASTEVNNVPVSGTGEEIKSLPDSRAFPESNTNGSPDDMPRVRSHPKERDRDERREADTRQSGKKMRMKRTSDFEMPYDSHYEFGSFSLDGGCDDNYSFGSKKKNVTTDPSDPWANTDLSAYGSGGRMGRVHVVEAIVTLFVKDINDNRPVFPNATMFGEVQENGPIDLSVAVVSAWDADDTTEGNNAKITYSIEKNVVHERTGEPIFSVHPKTGLVTTAVCCLDRETTPEYHIQVVATDGGGLKGTGTVIVRLADVNDNSPRLAKKMWEVEIDETWGPGPPDNSTLLEISVNDRDTANYFFFRVVEESGWGWAHFGIRSVGTAGHLYARQTLDFEDDTHRRGFKFMIQVTDRGRGGWVDPRHLDSAWVKVRLHDLNDNPPRFHRPHAHVTVREDAPPGTLLATLPANDPDMGGTQSVEYRVVGGWGALTVDEEGSVSLWRSLDREASNGAIGIAKVMGVDNGQPPLTSTATLTITVTDVNDCPPRLLPPTVFHVTEGAPPTLVGVLAATDHDVWALGHGPPFNLSMAPSNPSYIMAHIDVKFDPHLDSGRGGAEVWTKESIDREQYRELSVGVLLKDAGALADIQVIKVIIDDVNDNPMKPATKIVHLWKTQTGSSDAPLGRVYVDDPDDWDVGDKVFEWVGQPHPLFSLNSKDGTIFASSQVREGRYELQFAVSDTLWGQRGVSANVTVAVRLLTQDALAHSTPMTLTPTTPETLTAGWTPTKGGGGLGRLIEGVKEVVGNTVHSVEVVSVYDITDQTKSRLHPSLFTSIDTSSKPTSPSSASSSSSSLPSATSESPPTEDDFPRSPSTCVWLSVKEKGGHFMDPVKLHGILGLHSSKLERATNLTVLIESPRSAVVNQQSIDDGSGLNEEDSPLSLDTSSPSLGDPLNPSSAASRASTSLPLQVVDTNSTSLVTPRLTRATHCSLQEPETCTPISCLNGGRCIRTLHGNRCVCPSGSWGYQCKVLSRTFKGSGFAWIRPLPSCLPTMISFQILTHHQEALLLYAGPLVHQSQSSYSPPTPLLALQLVQGEVQMVVEGGAGPMKLQIGTRINDGNWHVIHARLDVQGVSLMVDLCGKGWEDEGVEDDSHCVARMAWRYPKDAELWFSSAPIQLGGIAHTPPRPQDHGWTESPIYRPLDGCLSHLNINGQLMDLGEPALSKGSVAECVTQEASCGHGLGACGVRGTCVGGLNHPECQCEPGWTGPKCANPTVPASLGSKSYMKMALSFTPASRVMTVQVRVRTRGRRSGLILHMTTQDTKSNLSLELQGGIACASLTSSRKLSRMVCVEGRPLGDGMWHTVRAQRHGHNLLVSVDDADGWRQNYSLPSLFQRQIESNEYHQKYEDITGPPLPLDVDRSDGVTVAGLPEFVGVKLITVYDDLKETCLDDLRISGQSMPLAPTLNGTTWGQVTTFERVEPGCNATDACPNITCASPLSCISNWGRPTCSCGQGRHLIGRTCEDVDECLWRPCLHGGSCYNMRPGFMCVCGPGYSGEHCQWNNHNNSLHPLAGPAAIAAITLSLVLLVVLGVILSFRLRKHWAATRTLGQGESEANSGDGVSGLSSEEATIIEVKGGTEEGGGKMSALKTDPTQEFLLESLNLKLPHIQPALQTKEKGSNSATLSRRPSKASLMAAAALLEGRAAVIGGDALMAKDDLRAYAYEGEGSSAGSLTSALSGLRVEPSEEGSIHPLVPAFLDVMDLLKNLPEASKSISFTLKQSEGVSPSKSTCEKSASQSSTTSPPPSTNASTGKATSEATQKTLQKEKDDEISTIC